MEDKKLKKRLKKIPDMDKNGDPIYKIDMVVKVSGKKTKAAANDKKRGK